MPLKTFLETFGNLLCESYFFIPVAVCTVVFGQETDKTPGEQFNIDKFCHMAFLSSVCHDIVISVTVVATEQPYRDKESLSLLI